MKNILIFFLMLQFISLSAYKTIYIVVHGTWAIESNWWHPRGDFYKELKKNIHSTDKIISFAWSGDNNDKNRHTAAERILALITSYYNVYEKTIIVTHSHGGNIVNIATQMAEDHYDSGWFWNKNSNPLISIVYAMGTPVHEDYYPNMNVIGNFYNLYSKGDYVQPVLGIYHRTYPQQEKLTNIEITINDSSPGHSELHCRPLAKQLAYLYSLICNKTSKNSHGYTEGVLQLYNDKHSQFTYNQTEPELIQQNSERIEWIGSDSIVSCMLFEEHQHLLPNELFENHIVFKQIE